MYLLKWYYPSDRFCIFFLKVWKNMYILGPECVKMLS